MHLIHRLLQHLNTEHVAWFGAGLSAAALGLVAYQLLAALVPGLPSPGPQPAAAAAASASERVVPTRTPTPTPTPIPTRTPYPTRTPHPTHTPFPTRTPRPTATPTPEAAPVPDVLATLTLSNPDAIVAAVATFSARTNAALQPLHATAAAR